jgi:hypothetical protein
LVEYKNWWGFEKASDDFTSPETSPKFLGCFLVQLSQYPLIFESLSKAVDDKI